MTQTQLDAPVRATIPTAHGEAVIIQHAPEDFTLMYPWGETPFSGTLREARAILRGIITQNENAEKTELLVIGSQWEHKKFGHLVRVINVYDLQGLKYVSFLSPNSKVSHTSLIEGFFSRYDHFEAQGVKQNG